jgi:glycosyltransferase involved in cell wall biosynthesis
MNVSVVLSTWNNADRLGITLEAMTRLEDPRCPWEVVVVNNNCTDHTDDVADRFVEELPLVYVHEPKPGLSNGRNAGIEASRGEWLVFTDDDVKPSPAWLSAYLDAFDEYGPQAIYGGPVVSEFEGPRPPEPLLRRAPCSVSGFDLGLQRRPVDQGFLAANWACTRQAMDSAGGFDPDLGLRQDGAVVTGEENDVMNRLRRDGLQAIYVPDASLLHFVPDGKCTLAHVASRTRAYGRFAWRSYVRDDLPPTGRVPRWLLRAYWTHRLVGMLLTPLGEASYEHRIRAQHWAGVIDGLKEHQPSRPPGGTE